MRRWILAATLLLWINVFCHAQQIGNSAVTVRAMGRTGGYTGFALVRQNRVVGDVRLSSGELLTARQCRIYGNTLIFSDLSAKPGSGLRLDNGDSVTAERAIEIVTDRGLGRHADTAHWQRVMMAMREAFRAGQFEAGLNQAVDAVDALLTQHFPLAPGQVNPNELSNAPVVR